MRGRELPVCAGTEPLCDNVRGCLQRPLAAIGSPHNSKAVLRPDNSRLFQHNPPEAVIIRCSTHLKSSDPDAGLPECVSAQLIGRRVLRSISAFSSAPARIT